VRSVPTSALRLYHSQHRTIHARLTLSSYRVTDFSVELTDYEGQNWLVAWETRSEIDNPVGTATFRLQREAMFLSLSPLVVSKLNRVDGVFAPMLTKGRKLTLEVQVVPLGSPHPGGSGSWLNIFEGLIDSVDFGGDGDEISVACRDLTGIVQDVFIEADQPPRANAANWYTGISYPRAAESLAQDIIDGAIMDSTLTWAVATNYAVDQVRRPSTRNEFCYRVSAIAGTGTSHATTEPAWPEVIGETVIDNAGGNQVTWECYRELPTLTTYATGVNIKAPTDDNPYVRQGPLLDALKGLLTPLAADVRFRWNSTDSAWRLTMTDDGTVSGDTFDPDEFVVTASKLDGSDIRNRVVVPYRNSSDVPQTPETRNNTASQLKYGLKTMQLGEEHTFPAIASQAAAQDLGDKILDALGEPIMTADVELPLGFPYVEAFDDMTFEGPNRYWTDDQLLLVIGVTHSGDADGVKTSMQCRVCADAAKARFGTAFTLRDTRIITGPTRPPVMTAFGFRSGPLNVNLPSMCKGRMYQSGAQTIATSTDTQLDFGTIEYDAGGDLSTASDIFTAPFDGTYDFNLTVFLAAVGASTSMRIWLKSGSTEFAVMDTIQPGTKGGATLALSTVDRVRLSAGDTVKGYVWHDAGAGVDTVSGIAGTSMTVVRV